MAHSGLSTTLAFSEAELSAAKKKFMERRWFDDCPIALSIDCETLSLDPRAHILQVGYCIVDLVTGQIISPGCNVWIDPDVQKDRVIDPDTVRWWLSQNADVRARVWGPPPMGYSSPQELFLGLKKDIDHFGTSLRVWVRGNKDLVWLETLWGGTTPWHYRQATDMRPFVLILDPDGTLKPEEEGSKHDGADDAMHQAQYLIRIVNRLRQTEEDAALYRKRVSP